MHFKVFEESKFIGIEINWLWAQGMSIRIDSMVCIYVPECACVCVILEQWEIAYRLGCALECVRIFNLTDNFQLEI